ncbi:MAG TPA: isoprenylcysteine carboxylmethyltransferase family protein [Ktedonobacterales bacterium]
MLPLPFAHAEYAAVLWLTSAVWAAMELPRIAKLRAARGATVRDRGSLVVVLGLLALGILGAFACAVAVPGTAIAGNSPAVFWAGIVCIVLGIALRWYAIRVLGRYFTPVVAVHSDQQIVQEGPYRYVRHPSYSGALLSLVGLGLALTNWLSLLVLLICALAGLLYRVNVEERALCETLGQPYADYMRRTRRFIPFIW